MNISGRQQIIANALVGSNNACVCNNISFTFVKHQNLFVGFRVCLVGSTCWVMHCLLNKELLFSFP